jgi:1-deoxy-D-xylulose-5-phosphate reductoisomerase
MTFPLQHALLYPERAPGTDAPLDLCQPLALDFRPVDDARYPCLRLARAAMTAGGVAPAVFNAANEIAVAAFLAGRAPFLAIPEVIDQTLQSSANFEPADLEAVLTADAAARRLAQSALSSLSTRS